MTGDITATESVIFYAPESTSIDVELDLNGYTLQFAEASTLFTENREGELKLSVISRKNGGVIDFLYTPEMVLSVGIVNECNLTLKNISIATLNNSTQTEEVFAPYGRITLISNYGSANLVVESVAVKSSLGVFCAIKNSSTSKTVIADSLIEVVGTSSVGIHNDGSILEIRDSVINSKGDSCGGIISEPLRTIKRNPHSDYIQSFDLYNQKTGDYTAETLESADICLNNCIVSASGNNAIGVAYEGELSLINSEITSIGMDAEGLMQCVFVTEDKNVDCCHQGHFKFHERVLDGVDTI